MPWQMASARSAINYLQVHHHTLARIANPSIQVHPEKLTTKDAVVSLAYERGVKSMKKRKEKMATVGPTAKPIKSSKRAKATHNSAGESTEAPDNGQCVLQSDPLQGKIREPLPETNLERAMKW
jgi:hypothetical protein